MSVVEPLRRAAEAGTTRNRVTALVEAGMDISKIAVEAGARRQDLQTWFETKAPSEKIEQRLAAWLEESDLLQAAESEPDWVETETSARIMAALEFTRKTPTIGVIHGAAGGGKTKSGRRFQNDVRRRMQNLNDDPVVYYVTAAPHITTSSSILHAIAGAMNHYACVNAYRNLVFVEEILRKTKPGDLICVDEAQFLEAAALDMLRYLYDQGGIGIAYLGNDALYTRISGKGRRAEFAQLHSRVGMRLHIEAPKEGDVDAFLEAWGISGRTERDYGQQIAAGPGGLRQLAQVLRQARLFARSMKRPIDQRVMRAAAGALGL